jgi:hypothetical protein
MKKPNVQIKLQEKNKRRKIAKGIACSENENK